MEPLLHFGFQNKAVDSIKVKWQDGKEQLIKNPLLNKLLTLDYKNAVQINTQPVVSNASLFTECSKEKKIHYKHQEDEFVDFKLQPLMPHLLSHEGPGMSAGDVNGDGLEDFFVGVPQVLNPAFLHRKKMGYLQSMNLGILI